MTHIMHYFNKLSFYLSNYFQLNPNIQFILYRVINILIIIIIAWVLCFLVSKGEAYFLSTINISKKDHLKKRGIITQIRVLKKITFSGILIITIAFILMLFDSFRSFGTSLLASAGVAGIAATFAAQKTLSNLFVGFQLAITQPIRLDDVLVVEGEWGKVEEITLTYVIVALWDQRRLILPISYFLEKPFQNWTRKSSAIIGTVFVYVDYFIPIEKIEEEARKLCQTSPLWDGQVFCTQVTNLNATNVEIRVIASSVDAPTCFDLRCYLRKGIIEFIRNNYPECFAYNRVMIKDLANFNQTK